MSQQATKRKQGSASRSARRPSLFTLTIIAMVVLGVLAVVVSRGDRPAPADEVAAVTIEGTALPEYVPGAEDGAAGMTAPTLRGQTFDGDPVAVEPGQGPMAVLFLAHWCPHCQREVDQMVPWLEAGGLPAGVELVAVSTMVDAGRANYPPSDWLADAGWEVPTLVDDVDSGAAVAYGAYGTPYWVFLNADGTVAGRVSGEIPVDRLGPTLQGLASR